MSEKYTKKELKELYEYYCENEATPATKTIKSNYSKMHDAFNDYLEEVQVFEWINGFLYAVKLAKEGLFMSTAKECIDLIPSFSSDQELREMMNNDELTEGIKACILEEIERRKAK